MIIRDALPEDMESIRILMSTYFLDIDGVPAEDFAIALIGGKVIGAGAIVNGRFPEIHSIAVHPNYRGRGIGSFLIHHLLTRIKETMGADHGVYARTTSPRFFEKVGFMEADPSVKADLWEDCAGCDRLNTCRQSVMCLEQGSR